MIGRKAAWRTTELAGIVPVEMFADRTPFPGGRNYSIPDFEQGWGFGMPQARCGETSTRFKMEIKAGRVNVLASMGKAHGDVSFLRTLVMGKSRVAIDAKHRAARGAGVGHEI